MQPLKGSSSTFVFRPGQLYSSGSPCPTNEWTLCLFATFLARFVRHSTIKVYLSGFHVLHVEQGLPDPLHLQRVVRGIKVCQGSSSSNSLPITDSHMLFISKSLNMHPGSLYVLGMVHAGVLWFPPRCWVYSAQSGQLLFFNSLDCAGYCSGWSLVPFLYACHHQGV